MDKIQERNDKMQTWLKFEKEYQQLLAEVKADIVRQEKKIVDVQMSRTMQEKQVVVEATTMLESLDLVPKDRMCSKLARDFKGVIPRRVIEETLSGMLLE